jgi:hypothetical protein
MVKGLALSGRLRRSWRLISSYEAEYLIDLMPWRLRS